MASGMKVGWLVVGIVSVLTGLAALIGPATLKMPSFRSGSRAARSEVKHPAATSDHAGRTPVSARPTVVRLRSAEEPPTTTEPVGISPVWTEIAPEVLDVRPGTTSDEAVTPIVADRPIDPLGNRVLRALFPRRTAARGEEAIPDLSPPPVSLPSGMERVLR